MPKSSPNTTVFTVQCDPAHLALFDKWADHNDRTRSGQFRWMMKHLMEDAIYADVNEAPDDIATLAANVLREA